MVLGVAMHDESYQMVHAETLVPQCETCKVIASLAVYPVRCVTVWWLPQLRVTHIMCKVAALFSLLCNCGLNTNPI